MTPNRIHHGISLRPVADAVCKALLPAGAAALLAVSPLAQAAPQGGQVVAGQARISQGTNLTTVLQQSNRAAINWQSFNVGAGETVRFHQPSSTG